MDPQTNPTPQPPIAPPIAPPPTTSSAADVSSKTDVMGIISIILAFTGLQLVGFILGLLGASQAKKEHRSPVLSRIGWIINLVFGILAMFIILIMALAIPNLQKNSRDVLKKSEMTMVSSELESFYNKSQYYPATIAELKVDTPNSALYTYTPAPTGCTQCAAFVLQTELESSGQDKNYKIESLNKQ